MSTQPHSMTTATPDSKDTQSRSQKSTGERESSSPKDGELSRDGRFRWSAGWHRWVPTGKETVIAQEEIPLLGMGPLNPTNTHLPSCLCAACVESGQHYADYLKNRDLWGGGGL